MDWFPFDRDACHERVKEDSIHSVVENIYSQKF